MRRLAAFFAAVFIVMVGVAAPVSADPPGPTEYLSTIQAVEPPTGSIAVRMIGGDSFFEVSQLEPVLIEVVGYQGEPYLRISPDGVVEENRLSASTYLNQERYGAGDIVPDFVENDADPDWVQVGTGGRYAWHDHRSHWMNPKRPPGAEPGDTILEAVIPLRVDGNDVSVTVVSILEEPASPLPAIGGAAVGLVAAALLMRRQMVALSGTHGRPGVDGRGCGRRIGASRNGSPVHAVVSSRPERGGLDRRAATPFTFIQPVGSCWFAARCRHPATAVGTSGAISSRESDPSHVPPVVGPPVHCRTLAGRRSCRAPDCGTPTVGPAAGRAIAAGHRHLRTWSRVYTIRRRF